MAEVVLGLASSHTPQLSTSADYWTQHAARDQGNTRLLGSDGRYYTYDELLATADPALGGELRPPVWRSKFDRAQGAVEVLARRLAAAEPDVVVIVRGDDQHELFGAERRSRPSGCSPGNPVDLGRPTPSTWPGPRRTSGRQRLGGYADEPDSYPVAAELSEHLARELTGREFDVTVMSQQPAGRSLGHAFTFGCGGGCASRLRFRSCRCCSTPISSRTCRRPAGAGGPRPRRCARESSPGAGRAGRRVRQRRAQPLRGDRGSRPPRAGRRWRAATPGYSSRSRSSCCNRARRRPSTG